jgi:hypothetical protein
MGGLCLHNRVPVPEGDGALDRGFADFGEHLFYKPSDESRGGRSPTTKAVDKPPTTAADPPHRRRLEAAAMQSSLDAFFTPAEVPTELSASGPAAIHRFP